MSERLRTTIAEILTRFRVERHWSLRELAERSGLSIAYLSELERGRKLPTLEVLDRLAAAFGMTTAEFFGALAGQLARQESVSEGCNLWRGLEAEDRQELLRYADYLRWRRARSGRGSSGSSNEA